MTDMLAAAIAKRDALRAAVSTALDRETKAIADAKKEGSALPPNFWEPRCRLQSKLRMAEALVDAMSEEADECT